MAAQSKEKSGSVGTWLRQTFTGALGFAAGFIVGTIIDIIFYRIYVKWDPSRRSLEKLLSVVALQILVLTAIISFEANLTPLKGLEEILFRLSLVMSQIFMVKYTMERISDLFYFRSDSKRWAKQSRPRSVAQGRGLFHFT